MSVIPAVFEYVLGMPFVILPPGQAHRDRATVYVIPTLRDGLRLAALRCLFPLSPSLHVFILVATCIYGGELL